MNAGPAFSVIIPAFNNAQTIARAIESCLAQTYLPQEIIVIDDGSNDLTTAVVNDTFGSQVRLISFPENKGPSAARNAGLNTASGTHIAFLDADDYWLPQKLEQMAAGLKRFPEAVLLFHDYSLFPQPVTVAEARMIPFRNLIWHNPVATPCAVVRHTALRFDERLRWMEDWDFFLRTAEIGSVVYLPQLLTVLGRPVLSAGGQSSRQGQMRKAELQVAGRYVNRHKIYLPLLPLWALFIGAKHVYQAVRRH